MKKTLLVITIVGFTIWYLIGAGFIIAGAILKILYFPYANLLLIIGLVSEILLIIMSTIGAPIIAIISTTKE